MSQLDFKVNLFKQTLKEVDLDNTFEEIDGDKIVAFQAFQTMKSGRCMILVILDESVYSTASITFGTLDNLGRKEKVMELFNDLNQDYKLTKFYINEKNELVGQIGYIADGDEFNVNLFLSIIIQMYKDIEDNIYSKVMRIIWA